jgi:glycosyltransferase involved in cell wall biosynthesis
MNSSGTSPSLKSIKISGPVLFPFTGAGVGGSHISTFHLARSLTSDYGIETVVIAVRGSSVEREARAFGLQVRCTDSPPATKRSSVNDVLRFRGRRDIMAGFGPSAILHCNDLWTLQGWSVVAKSLKIPIFYHHRAFERMHWPNRLLLRTADAVICISQACRKNLEFLGGDRAVNVLNPFLPMERAANARAEFETIWPVEGGLLLIGFAANFQTRKRPKFFLDVCGVISRQCSRARFVMFGRDRDFSTDQLRAYARQLGIGDKVFFAGFRSPPENNLAPLDVFLAPALAEPFGRTLVESLLVGTPYVATDDAGHSEIISRWGGGLKVPLTATPDEFAAAAMKVLADPQNVKLTAGRIEDVARELAPRSHAAKICDVYRVAVAGRKINTIG